MARQRKPVFLVVDTCVWLDLAKDYSQEPLLSALEDLVRMNFVSLIIPKIVVDELDRNKERVIEESGTRIEAPVPLIHRGAQGGAGGIDCPDIRSCGQR
jgi:PIN domain-containing protein